MKKRKPSDFIRDDIRRKRRKYTKKIDNETETEKKIRKKAKRELDEINASKTSSKYLTRNKKDRMLSAKDYSNLRKTPCPEILCLDTKPDETMKFLNGIPGAYIPSSRPSRKSRRRRIRKYNPSNIRYYFDFSSVKKICPASALIISSCYSLYKKRGGEINVYDWEDWDEGVRDTLAKMGFFKHIGFDLIQPSKDSQAIPITSFCSDNKTNTEAIAEYFEKLVQKIDKTFSLDNENDSLRKTLAAISEASENCVRHAYPIGFREDVRDRWWFGGMVSLEEKEITFVCHDKGISIPKHIREADIKDATDLEDRGPEVRERIRKVFARFMNKTGQIETGNNLDHKFLELATKMAITSTNKDGSGRGLGSITETIKDFSYGQVKIMSRRAHAVITKDKRSRFTLLDVPMIGTLIIWKITL